MNKYLRLTACMFMLSMFAISHAQAKQFTIEQNDKKFKYNGVTAQSVNVSTGDEISFKNTDSVFHNIYSFSKIKKFNLGAYGTGESASVVFDKAGTVDIQCGIHPRMMIKVIVEN